MKRVLLTGAAGFVGPYLIREMKAGGWDVIATKLPSESIEPVEGVEIRDLDVMKPSDLDCLSEVQPDCVIHLAGISSVKFSWQNPDLTMDVNIKGVSHLLESIRKMQEKPRVLLIGSSEIYGLSQKRGVLLEDMPAEPANYYAISKYAQEKMGFMLGNAYGIQVISTRSFNHIGPGQNDTFVVPSFCRQIAEIEAGLRNPVILVGNLNVSRDFTDVRDIVRAYRFLTEEGKPGTLYNVGSGKAVHLDDLLKKLISMSTRQISVRVDPSRFRPADMPYVQAGIDRLQRDTGWAPVHELEDTLRETLDSWREQVQREMEQKT